MLRLTGYRCARCTRRAKVQRAFRPKQPQATVYLLVDQLKRADAEDFDHSSLGRRSCSVCYLPRIRVPAARFPPAETRTWGKTQFNLPCAPIGKYDSNMCQVSGHLGCNDQNSAGRYPLISRPTHTSTSVGVVHNMSAFPLWSWGRDPFILKAPAATLKRRFARGGLGKLPGWTISQSHAASCALGTCTRAERACRALTDRDQSTSL
jgi:hypothetical protein